MKKGIRGLIIVLILVNMMMVPSAVTAQPTIPEDATITSATLSVYVHQYSGFPVTVHRITSDWDENTVTWSNFGNNFDPTVIGSFTPTVAGWVSIDVTDLVEDWFTGALPNYGFLLMQSEMAPADTTNVGFRSSENVEVTRRPKLEICYDQPGSPNTCVNIQPPGADPADIEDAYIHSGQPDDNFGSSPNLYTGFESNVRKRTLIRFFFSVSPAPTPGVSIVKYTNGAEASDPDGVDVPRIIPGMPVMWTYEITNTGDVSVHRDSITVTDDQPGVNPVFANEQMGNNDDMFDPGEVWHYTASGVALDLTAPPNGVITFPDRCTLGGAEPPRTAYVNQGTVTIPGATDTAQSSYCNPVGFLGDMFTLWFPVMSRDTLPIEPVFTPFRVTVGYEDLPLLLGQNDYDYNDWVVQIEGLVTLDTANPDLWSQFTMEFEPGARGAAYTHSFNIMFPANTFASNGTAELVIYGPNGSPLSTQTIPFVASVDNDFTIFANTGEVFPASLSNTSEDAPMFAPQRTASLTIVFDQPIPFNLNDYDFTVPHGTGLFFDPYITVRNTGDVVRSGDNRLLNVSEIDVDYVWPEERVRIDRAYPDISFTNGTPPVIVFPSNWWHNHNNCVVDGIPCR